MLEAGQRSLTFPDSLHIYSIMSEGLVLSDTEWSPRLAGCELTWKTWVITEWKRRAYE